MQDNVFKSIMKTFLEMKWYEWCISLCFALILFHFMFWQFALPKEVTYRLHCKQNLQTIAVAMQSYHDRYGCYPPAFVADSNGTPLYSWRVLLLPFLGEEELYERFNLNRSWDDDGNRIVLEKMPDVFRCPSAKSKKNMTSYARIVGPGTTTDGQNTVSKTDISRNTRDVILAVDTLKKIPWSAPIDITLVELEPESSSKYDRAIQSKHKGFVNTAVADGSSVVYMTDSTDFKAKAMISDDKTTQAVHIE